jgi:hypothetical protein
MVVSNAWCTFRPRDHAVDTACNSLPLEPALLASMETLGYACMTPVQAQGVGSLGVCSIFSLASRPVGRV